MRYQESAVESAELLRLILPRIAKHRGAHVPTTYALWYEYLAGVNRVIQSLVSSTNAVRQSTETLYKEVMATRDEMQQLRGQMGALQNLAQTDPLTRRRNRHGFEQAVAEYVQGSEADLGGCAP